MSSSEPARTEPEASTPFLVTSDPAVQITVYDTTRTMRGQAEGSLRMLLPPGLYRVQLERGGRVHDEIIDHETITSLRHDGPALQSPAPFSGADTSHDYYVAPAQELSVADTGPPLGPGPHDSRVFVFLRRAAREAAPHRLPSEPVTIHDADGRKLAEITGDNASIDPVVGYVAYSCRATPGTYRIRGAWSKRDVAIVVPTGRAAQVFVADTGSVRLAELRLALVPLGAGFDPRSPIWRAMESVLAALQTPDRPLPLAARILLPDAIEADLCLGIAAAHILWRSGDRHGLVEVMRQLSRYREIPDVAILDRLDRGPVWAYEPLHPSPAGLSDTPPLLRASLTMAMTRPELDPSTLSGYSALAHAARTGLPDSVWCTWSTRTWDQRWIEPAVERLRDRDRHRDAASIARGLALATETVEQALQAIDATVPRVNGRPLAAGQLVVPGYTIDRLLGRGARSTVYRARRLADQQEVALKIIPVPSGANSCARAHEALDRAKLEDLPQLLAATQRETLPGDTAIWLEMELCKGNVLESRPESHAPLPLREAHRRVLEALAMLAELHDRGVAHGDIKPANLLVRRDDNLALAGLGLAARRAIPAVYRYATDAPRLAPPDLLSSDEPPSLASDVWSMAATYYFLLTLEFPRDEYADQSELEAAMNNEIVSIARRRPDLPPELVRCIDDALAWPPQARPGDARAFHKRLASLDLTAAMTSSADTERARSVTDRPVLDHGARVKPHADRSAIPRHDGWKLWRLRAVRALLASAFRTRRRSAVTIGALLAVIVGGALLWFGRYSSGQSCERDPRSGDMRYRSEACLASYQRRGNQRDLALSADAYVARGELDKADQLARQLLPRSPGDAYAILGKIALEEHRVGDASRYAELAREAHTRSGDEHGLVGDAIVRARAAQRTPDLATALRASDEALGLAQRLQDRHAEVVASLARADVLHEIGETHGASELLQRASELATAPCDQASSRLQRGRDLGDAALDGLAMIELAAARQLNRACNDQRITNGILLNEAWLLRRTNRDDAGAALNKLVEPGGERPESLLLRGYLAADRGELTDADRDLDRAGQLAATDARWRWAVDWARAEVAEQRDDQLAEYHYRQAIASIAALRATIRTRSADLLSSHRGPYDGLIALLARHGRWRDVISIVLDLDASDMLRAEANEIIDPDPTASRVPAVTADAIAPAPPLVEDVLSAWRDRDLVVVIAPSPRRIASGHERAYRLRIADGQVTGEDVGDANRVQTLVNHLYEDPADLASARSLGSVMIPRGAETNTLHVLAIGAISKVPLSALRDDAGSLIVTRRPLARVLALAATRQAARGAERAIIIVDPRGDLPGAAGEGAIAARAAGPSAVLAGWHVGVAATRALLWTARDAQLLHVAGNAVTVGRWRALPLTDGEAGPADMVQHGLAPRIAFLSTSRSAAAMDEEGWGSLASALLESGTDVVIATDRSIEDVAALSLASAFYAQSDWRTDPARALTRVQSELDARSRTSAKDASSARSWAAFGVLRRPPFIAPRPAGAPPPADAPPRDTTAHEAQPSATPR